MKIVAVANQKGGVGKSTTVVNLGAWLALRGSRVLLVDLDPQANATTGVGLNPRTISGNIYGMLVNDLPVEDAIEPTSVKNLFCIPSTIDLAGAEIELVSALSRELKLKRALEPAQDDFDYVFIDCPPSLGLLTINALAAAHEVLVPIQCEFYALEGLGQLLNNVNLVQSSLNPQLRLGGIVLTMYDARTKLAEQVSNEVRSHFPGKVFSSVIPRNVRLSEAPSFGQPIALYDPKSQGSQAYEALAAEVEGFTVTVAAGPPQPKEAQPESPSPPEPEPAHPSPDVLPMVAGEPETLREPGSLTGLEGEHDAAGPEAGPFVAGEPSLQAASPALSDTAPGGQNNTENGGEEDPLHAGLAGQDRPGGPEDELFRQYEDEQNQTSHSEREAGVEQPGYGVRQGAKEGETK